MASSFMTSQMEERARLNAEKTERAYAELAASVIKRGKKPPVPIDDAEQVDRAVKACLEYVRVKPGDAPQGRVDLEERIDWLCRPSGTMHRRVTLGRGWQKEAFGAMFGHLDTGEAVALIPRGLAGYWYLDPKTGEKVKVSAEVAERIDKEAVLFYRPFPSRPFKKGDLPSFVFGTLSRSDYLVVIGAAVVATLLGLLPAWANQVAFGVVAPSGQVGLLLPIAALLVGVTVNNALIGICRNLIMARVSIKLDMATESATYARVLSLPAGFFKDYAAGELARRMGGLTSLCQQMASILLGSGLTALLSLVYVAQIFAYTPALTVPALLVVLVQAVFGVVSTILTVKYEKRSMEADAKVSGVVTALLKGIQKIKLAGAEDLAFAKWAGGYAEYANSTYNRPVLLNALPALVGLVGLLGNILIYYMAATSGVTYDNYMAFTVAFGQTTGAIMALTSIAGQIACAKPMLEMVQPILDADPETDDDRPSVESLSGAIEVSGVSFRYGENLPYILRDLSFSVKPGEYVALVGESGCGKSTILRLLLGFEEPELGSIFYGPHDIQKVNLRSLRRHIGTVMQDSRLFMGDIFSNITISAPSATLDDAWEAAEIAGIAGDIRKMPMGMQTIVSEGGGGVSGGQRQRIMIARAVCGDRRILMFDEATSALDNLTQKHVADSLAKLNCTRIVIAHRLSTVRECDRILVVAGGGIAEEGAYDELIEKGGLFADLVARQRVDGE
ncbi:MAG: ATP-binding cassette domain-containing protein [Coriobacteriaceae bacterium]|nr:ATP-binding cassette domain-containing protein [Coriobacteriaceae bacterium]